MLPRALTVAALHGLTSSAALLAAGRLTGGVSLRALLISSFLPTAKVICVAAGGYTLAHERVGILRATTRHDISKLIFYVFLPCFIFVRLGSTITLTALLRWWFIPVNVALAAVVGCSLGLLICFLFSVPADLVALTTALVGIGNQGNMPVTLMAALCRDPHSPFGHSASCERDATAYVALGMWMAAVIVWGGVHTLLAPPQSWLPSHSPLPQPPSIPRNTRPRRHRLSHALPSLGELHQTLLSSTGGRDSDDACTEEPWGTRVIKSCEHLLRPDTPETLHRRGRCHPHAEAGGLLPLPVLAERARLPSPATPWLAHGTPAVGPTASPLQHLHSSPMDYLTLSGTRTPCPSPSPSPPPCVPGYPLVLPPSLAECHAVRPWPWPGLEEPRRDITSRAERAGVCGGGEEPMRQSASAEGGLCKDPGVRGVQQGHAERQRPQWWAWLLWHPCHAALQHGGALLSPALADRLCGLLQWMLQAAWNLLRPPVIAASLAVLLGIQPHLHSLLFSAEGPLHWLVDVADIFSGALIPCILMVIGGNMAAHSHTDSIGGSKLSRGTQAAIVVARLVLAPCMGAAVVFWARGHGLFPTHDRLLTFVLLLQHSMPASVEIGTCCSLHKHGEREAASVLFYQHIAGALSVTVCLFVYLFILFGSS